MLQNNRSYEETLRQFRKGLFTIYKSFIRSHLDHGDILYDKPENQNFLNKLEIVQYKACLATGAIQGSSRQKKLR